MQAASSINCCVSDLPSRSSSVRVARITVGATAPSAILIELILLFLYLGVIGLYGAIDDKKIASKSVAILAIVGVVNIPIIHYSVEWWNTLHQGPTVTKMDKPSIHVSMLIPLLLMALSFKFYYLIALIQRSRVELLNRERNSQWVKTMVSEQQQ